MGRKVMRVPPDFTWPLKQPWKGYLTPYVHQWMECPECDGAGFSLEHRQLDRFWYGAAWYNDTPPPKIDFKSGVVNFGTVTCQDGRSFEFTRPWVGINSTAVDLGVAHLSRFRGHDAPDVGPYQSSKRQRVYEQLNSSWCHMLDVDDVAVLVKENRLWDFTRTWSEADGWVKKDPPVIPTPEEVNAASLRGMGHDAINRYVVLCNYLDRRGLPSECSHCKGEGGRYPTEEIAKQAEDWRPEDPEKGEGYQLWETVSEGSPISPVFLTPADLATWLTIHARGLDTDTSYSDWLTFIEKEGQAFSMMVTGGEVKSGVIAEVERIAKTEPVGEPHD